MQSLEARLTKSIKNNITLQSEVNLETGITYTPIQSTSNLNKYSRKHIHFHTSPITRTRNTFYTQNIEPRAILYSEPTEFDTSTTSTDWALTSEKPVTNSLSPDEEELFWGARLTISRPSSPHETLQSELINIGNSVNIKKLLNVLQFN